jgi:hypothetical protein
MEFEPWIEYKQEPKFIEVSKKELAKFHWRVLPQTNGHVFTVVVLPGTDLEKALTDGQGIYVRHWMKEGRGRKLLTDRHFDYLSKRESEVEKLMVTSYNPAVAHGEFKVLQKD